MVFSLRGNPNSSALATLIIGVGIVLKLTNFLGLKFLASRLDTHTDYSYLGADHPERWPIEQPRVLGAFDNSNRYHLDSPEGIAEWASLIPPNGGVIHLGKAGEPFTVSMIHQLRCLDIIREYFVSNDAGRAKTVSSTRHCLNYIRQMVTCRADTFLEPFRSSSNNKGPVDLTGVYECKDWEAVYDEIEKNYKAYEHIQFARTKYDS
ncbi:hypothetical protein BDZ94DRAFT_1319975 [Collybia nuda]|uniref:Uncharacterized protein n=1 Tax=Collybia nuda TaxID=64659 RepID=A0A9P5Y9U5_9AGAR|nr:hypothetical protein BDZ94DRAFT_1319975 [Collybia nuda]